MTVMNSARKYFFIKEYSIWLRALWPCITQRKCKNTGKVALNNTKANGGKDVCTNALKDGCFSSSLASDGKYFDI